MSAIAAIEAEFKTWPYKHQMREFEQSCDMDAWALLWQMRTGKSKVTIDTACHRFTQFDIDAVLVVAPNGVHENWIRRELSIHHWDTIERDTIVWRTEIAGDIPAKEKSRKGREAQRDNWWSRFSRILETDKLAWVAIASDTMTRPDVRRVVKKLVAKRRTMIVFDESDDFRTPGSKRTQMARALAKRCPVKRILTGTVVTNSPLAAWSQFELLQPSALGYDKYGDFKARYAEYEELKNKRGRRYKKLKRYKNLDELQTRMLPWSSVVLRSDCEDLPDVVSRTRLVEMTDEQKQVYRDIHSTYLLELEDELVSLGENAPKFMKLQQVGRGFVKDEFGDVHDIPGGNPALDALSDEVYLAPGKVIVWCQFREDIDKAVERLMADGHAVVQYHGRTSDADKAEVRRLFAPNADNDVKVLVAQPQAGSRGLDLSAAGMIVWYSHTFNAIHKSQADERATKIGGENVQMVHIVANPTDQYILDNASDKMTLADGLAGEGMKAALKRIAI